MCHIAGDKPDAKRYDLLQSEEQRQGFNNLIVLCVTHHRVIDSDEVTYTRPVLRQMKRAHEATATEDFVISDHQAEKIAGFLGGAITGTALTDIVREVSDVFRAIRDALPKSVPQPKESDRGPPPVLIDALRYAPTGTFHLVATDDPHRRLGEFFVEVFKVAGWRLIDGAKLRLSEVPPKPRLTLVFFSRDQHHVSNAQRAIWEVFDMCGFERHGEGTASKDGAGVLNVAILVTAQPR